MGLYPLLPGLDLALERLASGAADALGATLVGVYRHGSLASGAGDEWSDVDFLVLTASELSAEEERHVQAFHAELFENGPKPWAQRLDGSYAPVELFQAIDPARTPFLYLDNGASQLVRDPHCNTAVIRHLVREHGVTLAGPDPKELIEPISAETLRAEARMTLDEYAEWLERDGASFRRWDQAYLVLTVCRLVFTAATGGVAGKAEAAVWGACELDPRWGGIIRDAIEARDDPRLEGRFPADPAAMDETRQFVAYALAER